MADIIKTLAVLCIAEIIFELLMPTGGTKKQLKTVCSLMTVCIIAKLIISLLGR